MADCFGLAGMFLIVWSLYRLQTRGSLLAQRWRIDRFSPLYELLEQKGGLTD